MLKELIPMLEQSLTFKDITAPKISDGIKDYSILEAIYIIHKEYTSDIHVSCYTNKLPSISKFNSFLLSKYKPNAVFSDISEQEFKTQSPFLILKNAIFSSTYIGEFADVKSFLTDLTKDLYLAFLVLVCADFKCEIDFYAQGNEFSKQKKRIERFQEDLESILSTPFEIIFNTSDFPVMVERLEKMQTSGKELLEEISPLVKMK